ncbi:glycosyltransferase [Candidatus Pelagibacter communis]|uniref:glycosyltransferase n=1 Tax=Pelagibacter ubique TaxID=198252 RepID=UPI0015CF6439|nr:glycosyltransferase [Candidatus Pelagibacter ubique]
MKILLINLFKNINLICLSKKLVDDIKLFCDKKKKIFILNNFSTTQFKTLKKKKDFTFIYLSNLIPDKGIMTFLDAITFLNNQNYKNFKAKVIGDTTNIDFLKKIKKKIRKLPNVKYFGKLYGKNKFKELNNSNVFVLPTYYSNEAFPISILEAMSLNLPIISSRTGGIPDIVKHNKTGFLIKKNNSDQYAKYMSFYLNNKKLAFIHGINAKNEYNNKYTEDIFEKKLITILKKII